MRPPFISPALGQKILRAGKSVNFLRDCCGDSDWVQDRLHTALATSAHSLSPSQVHLPLPPFTVPTGTLILATAGWSPDP